MAVRACDIDVCTSYREEGKSTKLVIGLYVLHNRNNEKLGDRVVAFSIRTVFILCRSYRVTSTGSN